MERVGGAGICAHVGDDSSRADARLTMLVRMVVPSKWVA